MQIIDIAINSIALGSVALFTAQFVAGLMGRRKSSPGQLALLDDQLQPIWDECSADDGSWLAEVQQTAFIPNPDQWEATEADRALVDAHSAFIAQYWATRPIDNVVPFVRPRKRQQQAIDWASLAPVELRKACQQRSIKWRNAHGLNKHLSKAEMVHALSQSAAA